jgi:hypothetical protein
MGYNKQKTHGDKMSVVIIGSGISGLSLAIKLKILKPNANISIFSYGMGNSSIAGQRYRSRDFFTHKDIYKTDGMKEFFAKAEPSIDFWLKLNPRDLGINLPPLSYKDDYNWFGPKFGDDEKIKNSGKYVTSWFLSLAISLGVEIKKGLIIKINKSDNEINSITVVPKEGYDVESYNVVADYYVLAGGNIGGRLFESTNVSIPYSSQELAFNAKIPIHGAHLHMFHILGRCGSSFQHKRGCFETDKLSHCRVDRGPPRL